MNPDESKLIGVIGHGSAREAAMLNRLAKQMGVTVVEAAESISKLDKAAQRSRDAMIELKDNPAFQDPVEPFILTKAEKREPKHQTHKPNYKFHR